MMKTMKYYLKNIFLAASCLWLFTACNDFLTLYPEDDIVDDEYWKTGEDVQSVVASCYRFMLEDNVISRIIYWGEARSENMDYSTSASTDEQYLIDANLLSSNGLVTWGDFYKVINICNKVIKSAPAVRDRDANFTEERLHNYLAEVYTLRALCYFYLVRSFGGVRSRRMADGTIHTREDYEERCASPFGRCIFMEGFRRGQFRSAGGLSVLCGSLRPCAVQSGHV